jgi:hypothetical protein
MAGFSGFRDNWGHNWGHNWGQYIFNWHSRDSPFQQLEQLNIYCPQLWPTAATIKYLLSPIIPRCALTFSRYKAARSPQFKGCAAGVSPSGKAPAFDAGIRRFESCHPSQTSCKPYGSSENHVYYRDIEIVKRLGGLLFTLSYAM